MDQPSDEIAAFYHVTGSLSACARAELVLARDPRLWRILSFPRLPERRPGRRLPKLGQGIQY